ncbi:hypothetical protein VTO42DRAFT_1325 [Malbranchea cinnamomea]
MSEPLCLAACRRRLDYESALTLTVGTTATTTLLSPSWPKGMVLMSPRQVKRQHRTQVITEARFTRAAMAAAEVLTQYIFLYFKPSVHLQVEPKAASATGSPRVFSVQPVPDITSFLRHRVSLTGRWSHFKCSVTNWLVSQLVTSTGSLQR